MPLNQGEQQDLMASMCADNAYVRGLRDAMQYLAQRVTLDKPKGSNDDVPEPGTNEPK